MELVQTPPWGHWGHSQLPKDGEWVRVALLTLGEGAMNISGYGTPMERDPRADGCFWLQHLSTRCSPSSSVPGACSSQQIAAEQRSGPTLQIWKLTHKGIEWLAQARTYEKPWRWDPKCVSTTHGSWALTA